MALIVVLVNQSKLADVSDYKCEVLVGDGSPERSHVIACGKVTGHTRSDGWKALVRKALEILPDEGVPPAGDVQSNRRKHR